ncbi:MAPK-interacting and spindle-stabilizing protein-like [Acanthopagrus latus]|uniref:MAPK-interacting and spindle-stabilizing protein-like n=1 Tax=Acanthopagrus latus TaxID=8177 RepID=UPI00187C9AE0|nr:MAPK-interacting and spindle-stabilizing protein-like [Acanthopagrus latus]
MDVVGVLGQVGDVLGPVQCVLSLCKTIFTMAQNAKANKERCQRVAKRVEALQDLVLTIEQRGPGQISVNVVNTLKELRDTLAAAKQLIMKCSQTKAVMSFIKGSAHEEQFNKINERLSDNFQVLSGALQVEQGNVLHKVYETVTGRRQEEEYYSGQASCTSPTTPMPQPSAMPSMYSPTAPMPQPSAMPSMYSPTAPMPQPSAMPSMYSPTAPMPQPSAMPSMYGPTAPMPDPSAMPSMYGPTAPMPDPSAMPSMYGPTAPMPQPSAMPSMYSPMPPPGAFSPMPVSVPVSTTFVSQPVFCPPTVINTTFRPVLRTVAPLRAPVASVRSYVVNNSYFH